jgi:hypothetical protein
MKTIFSLWVIFVSSILFSTGQDSKIKFGKISPADLAMKVYAPDTNADAIILSKIGQVQYNVLADKYPLTEERHVVIKILKEAGINEHGNQEIEYYSNNNDTKIENVKALVHLPNGTDIKVDNSQIFDEKTNDNWSTKKIAFPGLVPGAIIEYQYSLLSDRMFHPVDWFFQSHIPIVYAELTTKIPEWFDYIILTQGLPLTKNEQEVTLEPITLSEKSRTTTGWVTSSQTNYGTIHVNFIHHTYVSQNVPALKEECCITTMKDYYSRIRFQLQSLQFPDQAREDILNSWNKLAEKLYKKPEWGGQFRNKHPGELVLEAAGMSVVADTSQKKTAQKLYDYINDNIQWNEEYGWSTEKDISAILKARSGNSSDLNKLMCAALLQSGIECKPVLISTRTHGKTLELYPFTEQFNHMVLLAKLDHQDVWIDLGNKTRPLGMIRAAALNSRGWIVDENNPAWTDIVPVVSKSIYLVKGSIDKEGNLTGDLETQFTGYHALDQRNNAKDEKEKFGENLIISGANQLKIDGAELINTLNPSLPFKMKAKINNQPISTVTPDKIYINPVFPQDLDENPFKLEERTYPIEMNYPEEISMIFNLTLPVGYVVESVPEHVHFVTEDSGIQVTYEATQTPGKVNVTMKYVLKQLQFDPADYAALKNFFNQRQQKFNEQIVLTKAF